MGRVVARPIADMAPTPRRRNGRPKIETPSAIDVHVGRKMRQRRALLGWSQETLATKIGLTFQQVQKYERGANRMGASRLWDVAKAMSVQPAFFFEGLEDGAPAKTDLDNSMARRETLELVRNYYQIESEVVRRAVFDMVKAIKRL